MRHEPQVRKQDGAVYWTKLKQRLIDKIVLRTILQLRHVVGEADKSMKQDEI